MFGAMGLGSRVAALVTIAAVVALAILVVRRARKR